MEKLQRNSSGMSQEITKELAKKLMAIEGEVRGETFKTDMSFILKEKGEEGIKRVEEEFERLGCPIKYREIKAMDFYPVGMRAFSLLVIKKTLNFDDEKIKEMGIFATKVSLIIKLFVKYFFSAEKVFFKEAPRMWRKHWNIGELEPVEFNQEKKYGIIRLKNFNIHSIYCSYFKGYLSGVLQMLVKASQITCEETKCSFQGDEYHEYLIKWE